MPGPLPPPSDDNKLPSAPNAPPGGGKRREPPPLQGEPLPRAPGLPPGYGDDDED